MPCWWCNTPKLRDIVGDGMSHHCRCGDLPNLEISVVVSDEAGDPITVKLCSECYEREGWGTGSMRSAGADDANEALVPVGDVTASRDVGATVRVCAGMLLVGIVAAVSMHLGSSASIASAQVLSTDMDVAAEYRALSHAELDASSTSSLVSGDIASSTEISPVYRGTWLHVPVVDNLGADNYVCTSWLRVQAVGPEPVVVALIAWGEAGFCPPQAAGPLNAGCSGLIKPGGAWFMHGSDIPDGTQSAMLFKLSGRRFSDDGLDPIFGYDQYYADIVCETLWFAALGGHGDFRRFVTAYESGSDYVGIPMHLAAGHGNGGRIVAEVYRECDVGRPDGATVRSSYRAVPSDEARRWDQRAQAYVQHVTLPFAASDGYDTWVYVHSAGVDCASLEVWLHAADECSETVRCEVKLIDGISGGETVRFRPADCVGDDWRGSATLLSNQPIATVVDLVGESSLMTYTGHPALDPVKLEQSYVQPHTGPATTLVAPMPSGQSAGSSAAIHVKNTSAVVPARVRASFVGPSGQPDAVLTDWICSSGLWSINIAAIHDLSAGWSGSVRIDSLPSTDGQGGTRRAPLITGLVTMAGAAVPSSAAPAVAAAYDLHPVHPFVEQVGDPIPGLTIPGPGSRVIAVPTLGGDASTPTSTTDVAVTNLRASPGLTDFAAFVFDGNGLVDTLCYRLLERETVFIDSAALAPFGMGFMGSMVISAVYWEHDEWARDGRWIGNWVNLGAVAVHGRSQVGVLEEPGDGISATAGIPASAYDSSGPMRFDWLVPEGAPLPCDWTSNVLQPGNGGE